MLVQPPWRLVKIHSPTDPVCDLRFHQRISWPGPVDGSAGIGRMGFPQTLSEWRYVVMSRSIPYRTLSLKHVDQPNNVSSNLPIHWHCLVQYLRSNVQVSDLGTLRED